MRIQSPKTWLILIILIAAYAWCCCAAMGETINLAAGTFNPRSFASGNTYVGVPGRTFIKDTRSGDGTYAAEARNLVGVTLQDIVFQGNATWWENCRRINFVRVGFIDARRTSGNHQATFLQGSSDVTFRGCFWRNNSQAIQAYNSSRVLFEDCTFESSGYGPKHSMNGSASLTFRRCLFRRMRTFALEIQNDSPAIDGILIEDCAFVEPERYDNDNLPRPRDNAHGMAMSVPVAAARNVIGRRNYIDGYAWLLNDDGSPKLGADNQQLRRAPRKAGPGVSQWLGWRVGIEVGGTRPEYYDNWIVRVNDAGAITTSTAAQVFNNRVEFCLEPVNFASPANGIAAARVGSRVENNDDQVALPRHGGWDLVGVVPPKIRGGDPGPAPSFAITASPVGDSTISFALSNLPAATAAIRIESVSTIGRETGPKVGPQGAAAELPAIPAVAVMLGGFHPGWQIDVRGLALDGSGVELARSAWITVQMPGDPTIAWPPTEPQPTDPTVEQLKAKIAGLETDIAVLKGARDSDAAKIADLERELAAVRGRLGQIHQLSTP